MGIARFGEHGDPQIDAEPISIRDGTRQLAPAGFDNALLDEETLGLEGAEALSDAGIAAAGAATTTAHTTSVLTQWSAEAPHTRTGYEPGTET